MRRLGNYLLSGAPQAVGVVSFLSIVSLIIPPATFLLSGAPLALITLRKGPGPALQIMLGSLCLCLILTVLTGLAPLVTLILMLGVWLPVYLCATLLRTTESQVAMALTAALLAFTYIIFTYLYIGDVENWWRTLLGEMPVKEYSGLTTEQYNRVIDIAPPLMNSAVASSIVFSLIMTLLAARYWQASLFNPGGFGVEFRAFRLPRQLALPSMLGIGLLLLENNAFVGVIRDTLAVVVVLYLFQGVVAVHRTVKMRSMSQQWLLLMYCLLFILPQLMVIFLAWMGMTDSLIKVRERSPEDDEK